MIHDSMMFPNAFRPFLPSLSYTPRPERGSRYCRVVMIQVYVVRILRLVCLLCHTTEVTPQILFEAFAFAAARSVHLLPETQEARVT